MSHGEYQLNKEKRPDPALARGEKTPAAKKAPAKKASTTKKFTPKKA